ncbi:GHKL domain-containing protein [Sphingobacterium sp. DK4209]|uniref:histidine kinase n=1 Tax=Sphingobacterium zhuxiongii TaxID=2662364 RepID=A0A5Q0QBN5_9SPHI|nr:MULTISPECIES: HAMP domain-containing sensor histidine kinase [unclassified Sphingobacterium]MVZ66458.1 GHKL domain-containing protein [Sphingobacterium sp. DK4209]QGA27305.1 GHKL domain-containing protein [Sphingobacterium sp. dk4302]
MIKKTSKYRKNLGLLVAFVAFLTILYIIAVFLARVMMSNYVESEFYNRKVDVFDATLKPFNNFFNNSISEVSNYQGYLDSVHAVTYSEKILRKNAFVDEVVFYDVLFTNQNSAARGVRFQNLLIFPQSIYSFKLDNQNKLLRNRIDATVNRPTSDDFNNMAIKMVNFLDVLDDSTSLTENDIYRIFYNTVPGKVTYLNIPRVNTLRAYKTLMEDTITTAVAYDQDLFVYKINPAKIKIENVQPRLFEKISVLAIADPNLTEEEGYIRTEMALPGALSEYKLQFDSSEQFLRGEINRQFFPVVLGVSLLYAILLLIVYLIYRNIAINSRLFQLQYDFINNLTHEFKTPVSVIKIAGNNIKSAEKISDQERHMYGKILDQEADKLNNLMNKLLSFTQIENKSLKFKGEYVDLNSFCEEIFEATRIKYPDLNLTSKIDVDSNIYTDPILLNSVFQNLIDNAYKYSEVSRKFVDIRVEQNKKNFVIQFSDQGIGINKHELKNIFKKFYRVKNQFNQSGSVGLGLAFCKEITEFMGGEIKVSSIEGEGTVFTLIFPR